MKALLALLALFALPVQTVDLSGTWAAQVEAARQSTSDGGSRSRSALKIELTLETRGPNATARFKSVVGGEVTLTGTWRDGKLDLESPWREVDITRDGKPDKAKARWVVKGGLKDGVLGGTWDFQMGDSALPQRWTARKK